MLHETLGKNLTPDQLQKALTDIIALAKRETNTKKKIGYVYGKSRLEDQLKVLEKSSLSTFDLLAQHLHVGDVLLLNKEDA